MKITLCINFVFELVKYFLLMRVLFEAKNRRKWFAGGMVVLYSTLIITEVFPIENLNNLSYITIAMVVVTVMVVVELPIKNRIFNTIEAWFILTCIADSAIGMVATMVEEKLFLVKIPKETNWVVANIIAVTILVVICRVKEKRMLENKRWAQLLQKGATYICIGIMAMVLPYTITGLSYMSQRVNDPELIQNMQILEIASFFSIIALIAFVIYVNNTNKKMKQYLEMERTLQDMQRNYYETLLAKEEDTKRFRHDIVNHFVCIRELIAKGDIESAERYAEDMQGNVVKIQQKCYSVGNTIIDAFLNYYIQMLGEDVEVSILGCLTGEISVSDMELCTIFSNLIKNSIEELKKPGEGSKYLEVKVNTGREFCLIEVSNSISKQLEESKENLPKTTKRDKKNHGIGLRNVQETVEKNHGTFEWKVEDSCFKTMVTLPLSGNA